MTYKSYSHDWFGLCVVGVRVDLNGMQIEPNVDNTEFELSREFYLEDTTANLNFYDCVITIFILYDCQGVTIFVPCHSCALSKSKKKNSSYREHLQN